MFPLFALCDRNDIGGIAVPRHLQLQKSAVFIYDGYPGGVGLSARGFELVEELLQKTVELIAACPCDLGCPSCIHSPKCGAGNKPLDKTAALFLARGLLGELSLELKVEEDSQLVVAEEVGAAKSSSEPNVAFFDLETQRLADEVGGWGNVHLMRLAVGVLYDKSSTGFEVFAEEQVENLIERLKGFDLVVGFNIKRFDYRVLAAYTGFDFRHLPTFDILEDIYQRLGFRLSLGHLAEQTLGKAKIADGIQAVRWLREGKLDAVVEYCKDDVTITKDLFDFGLNNGYLVYQTRDGQPVRLPVDWNLDSILREAIRS
jgi:DEAD/DEAH box helicase domain-containing protein